MHRLARQACIALAALAAIADADTLHVPGDYPTIQAAIDAARDGDEILVAPGEYHERPAASGKSLIIRSERGSAVTVIDGDYAGRVFQADACAAFTIQGFTIRDGSAPQFAGVLAEAIGTLTLVDVRIERNSAPEFGGGGRLQADTIQIFDSIVTHNDSADWESYDGGIGGIQIDCSVLAAERFSCSGNFTIGYFGGMDITADRLALTDCAFDSNIADSTNGIGSWGGGMIRGDGLIRNCSFNRNYTQWVAAVEFRGVQRFENCSLSGNSSWDHAIIAGSDAEFYDCIFERNSSSGAMLYGSGQLVSCRFVENEDNWAVVDPQGPVLIESSHFARNGGGPCVIGSAASTIVNCSFCSNASFGLQVSDPIVITGCLFSRQYGAVDNYSKLPVQIRDSWLCALRQPFRGPWEDLGGNEFCDSHPADFNGDDWVDDADVHDYLAAWTAQDPATDLDANGRIDTRDVIAFLNLWAADC